MKYFFKVIINKQVPEICIVIASFRSKWRHVMPLKPPSPVGGEFQTAGWEITINGSFNKRSPLSGCKHKRWVGPVGGISRPAGGWHGNESVTWVAGGAMGWVVRRVAYKGGGCSDGSGWRGGWGGGWCAGWRIRAAGA